MIPLQILERTVDGITRTAVIQEHELVEYMTTSENATSLVNSIFLGQVERVLPDVRAAFVKIGRPRNGFLPLKESDSFHALNGNASLITGQKVLVQVQKDEKGEKGAFLTRDISMAGQYMILMPLNRFIGVSKRIVDSEERKLLINMGKMLSNDRFGVVMRQAALSARYDQVADEAESIFRTWQTLFEHVSAIKAPAVIYARQSNAEQAAMDYASRHEVDIISVQQHEATEHIQTNQIDTTELEKLWREFRIHDQVVAATKRKVSLKDGSSLIIDEREALHTIDVNSGRNTRCLPGSSLAFQVNVNACNEIVRQIRLRNLSGIILIDFIDMASEEDRKQVIQAMEKAVQYDRAKTVIHGFTRLGLLEMTRKRTRSLLSQDIAEFGID